jgi:hypothetical protein
MCQEQKQHYTQCGHYSPSTFTRCPAFFGHARDHPQPNGRRIVRQFTHCPLGEDFVIVPVDARCPGCIEAEKFQKSQMILYREWRSQHVNWMCTGRLSLETLERRNEEDRRRAQAAWEEHQSEIAKRQIEEARRQSMEFQEQEKEKKRRERNNKARARRLQIRQERRDVAGRADEARRLQQQQAMRNSQEQLRRQNERFAEWQRADAERRENERRDQVTQFMAEREAEMGRVKQEQKEIKLERSRFKQEKLKKWQVENREKKKAWLKAAKEAKVEIDLTSPAASLARTPEGGLLLKIKGATSSRASLARTPEGRLLLKIKVDTLPQASLARTSEGGLLLKIKQEKSDVQGLEEDDGLEEGEIVESVDGGWGGEGGESVEAVKTAHDSIVV